ncbi:MAG: hypothetical protein ABI626_07050 [Sphingomicrobium sp.]
MKLLLATLALVLASSTASSAARDATARAQPEAITPAKPTNRWDDHVERARRFAALTVSGERFVESIHAAVLEATLADLPDPDDPNQRAYAKHQADDIVARAEPQIIAEISTHREFYALAYSREFSEEELQQMLAVAATPAGRLFSATPTGKRYAARIQAIEANPIVLAGQESLKAEAYQFLQSARREACAKRTQARIAAGDVKAKCSMG